MSFSFAHPGLNLVDSINVVTIGNNITYTTLGDQSVIIGNGVGTANGTGNILIGAGISATSLVGQATMVGAMSVNNSTGVANAGSIGYGATIKAQDTRGSFIVGGLHTSSGYEVMIESGPHVYYTANMPMTGTTTSETVSALQLIDGVIVIQHSASGTVTLNLAAPATIVAALPNAVAGTVIYGKICNSNANSRSVVISPTGWDYEGETTLAVNMSINYVIKFETATDLIFYS